MIPEIHQDIRSRTEISGHLDRVLAQDVDAVPCSGSHLGWRYYICNLLPGDSETSSKTSVGFKYVNSYDKGSTNHTRHMIS